MCIRDRRIMNTPCKRQPQRRFPTKAEMMMQRGRPASELSPRPTPLIKRSFDFWCTQIDSGSDGMSLRCFLAFCREARVVSDQLAQQELCELFEGFCQDKRLLHEPFFTVLQQIADKISAGDLSSLLLSLIHISEPTRPY
eukprot:TRINITY_DN36548_c0_g1_i1.p1 TRINITY_DN36548_c0_g1~~TRINITY_DN36548_c0_g1_i1.p1  ORF type:complete len:140 (+),score=24.63 TRINITY_DN36548_c0_g1_i1:166-585(+)